ncbi:hypothetical protein [Primorskyibacter sp. S87]
MADGEAELNWISHMLRPHGIVVANTPAGDHEGEPVDLMKGCGMG